MRQSVVVVVVIVWLSIGESPALIVVTILMSCLALRKIETFNASIKNRKWKTKNKKKKNRKTFYLMRMPQV